VFSNEFSVHTTSFNSLSNFCTNVVKVLSLVGKIILKAEISRKELYELTVEELQ